MGENTLVIDITSGTTGAALVHTHKEGVPEIITRVRTPFYLEEEAVGKSLDDVVMASLKRTLESMFENLKKLEGKSAIDDAVISLASPLIVSHFKTIKIERAEPFVFSKEMMLASMNEEKEIFKHDLSEQFDEEMDIFESATTNLYLNGYEATHPVKEKVKDAELSFIISATTKDLIKRIEHELTRVFHVKRGISLHNFMYIYYKVLSHSFQNLHSAFVISMTLEASDIIYLRRGSTAVNASLAMGPATLARAVAKKFDLPIQLAYSYLKLFAVDALDEKTTGEVAEVIHEAEEDLRKMWINTKESVLEGKEVPYSVFIVVPTGFEKLMKKFLGDALPGHKIIILGETNAFTKELVKIKIEMLGDERILILSSFSNFLK